MSGLNLDLAQFLDQHLTPGTTFLIDTLPCTLNHIGNLIHMHIYGPLPSESSDGHSHIVTFTDDFSHFTLAYTISSFAEILTPFRSLHLSLGHPIHHVQTDLQLRYLAEDFRSYLHDHDITLESTSTFDLISYGPFVKLPRVYVQCALAMITSSGLPSHLWGASVAYTCYLSNRLSSPALGGRSPFSLFRGTVPDLHDCRTFGSPCRILEGTSTINIYPYLGRSEFIQGWRYFNPLTNHVATSPYLHFDDQSGSFAGVYDPPLSTDSLVTAYAAHLARGETSDFIPPNKGDPLVSSDTPLTPVALSITLPSQFPITPPASPVIPKAVVRLPSSLADPIDLQDAQVDSANELGSSTRPIVIEDDDDKDDTIMPTLLDYYASLPPITTAGSVCRCTFPHCSRRFRAVPVSIPTRVSASTYYDAHTFGLRDAPSTLINLPLSCGQMDAIGKLWLEHPRLRDTI